MARTLQRGLLLCAATGSASALSISQSLGSTLLTPLESGRAAGAPVTLSSLYEPRGAVVFAVRRPG